MKRIIMQLILSTMSILAFEVNTHQAITRCALTTECSQSGGISNLENFVKHTELNSTNPIYIDEIFDKYDSKYVDYVGKKGTGFQDWNISITPNYHGMIEAGSVLEDSIYHNAMNPTTGIDMIDDKLHKLHDADGRFNNHFYAVQFNSRAYCRAYSTLLSTLVLRRYGVVGGNLADYMKTEKTLCLGLKQRTDNIDWVFNEDVNLGEGRVNEYGLEDAFAYFKKSFDGNETERKKYQAKFFVTLGFMSHMLQDLHSPAHVRDGAHALGDYLEIYGRYEKGFNLKGGKFNPANEPEITAAIRSFNMTSYLSGMNFKSLEDFYYKEASWVSYNFFSEEHNSFETGNTETGAGIAINNDGDRDTIFDLYNDHLSSSETHEEDASEQWNYIKTDGKVGEVYGPIKEGHDTVAFIEKGWFFRDEHMLVPTEYTIKRNAVNEPIGLEPVNEYKTANTTALKDTAINVIPRAVASTQAFLNFFFRGQIGVTPIYGQGIDIYNDSKVLPGLPRELTRLKEGGKFYLYYMNEDDNISYPLRVDDEGIEIPYVLEEDLEINQRKRLYLSSVLDASKIDGETKIFVLYDGNIGDDDLGGNNTYTYGMRGMTADVAFHRFERVERDNGDDTVMDYAQGLEWQDINLPPQQAWNRADSNCTGLEYAGLSDWMLPTKRNLQSIVKTRGDSYIYKKFFKNMVGEDENQGKVGYWSTDFHSSTNTASVISFESGAASEVGVSYSMNFMCVRSIY